MYKVDSRLLAAKMLSACEQYVERRPQTPAAKRHELQLRALGIVTKDRIVDARVKKIQGKV